MLRVDADAVLELDSGSIGCVSGSTVNQFVNVSGRLQPRRASSVASWSSRAAIQLSIGVAPGID